MDTDKDEPLYKSESRKIVGAAMEVLNEISHGFHEKPYENGVPNENISVHQCSSVVQTNQSASRRRELRAAALQSVMHPTVSHERNQPLMHTDGH